MRSELLYQAFSPTVRYNTLGLEQSVVPFKSQPVNWEDDHNPLTIELRAPGGDVRLKRTVKKSRPSSWHLEIDLYGRFTIPGPGGTVVEIKNPEQHPLQQELWERTEAERQRQDDETRRRGWGHWSGPPGLDNN